MKKLLLILAFVPFLLFSQTRKQRKALAAQQKADQVIINNFKGHFQNLTNNFSAADSSKVREYIINQFKIAGLQPKGTAGYFQPFTIDLGKQIKAGTFLKVNGTTLAVKKEYFPLAYSAQKTVSGMPAMSLRERGVPWFADVKEWLDDNSQDAAFDINKRVQKEAVRAALKGATALFLYNSSNIADNLRLDNSDKTAPSPVPVIYITSEGYKHYFIDHSQVLDIELNVAFEEIVRNSENIAGFINNSAGSNIIIAAPYHKFFAADNDNTNKPADSVDIVSGTSVLIELAKMLTTAKAKNNNYTFVAYNGENLLSQSSKWLNTPALVLSVNYIINLSSVGIDEVNKKLLIKSYGTASNGIETIQPLADKNLEISFDTSHTGNKQDAKFPILDFFTANNNNFDKNSFKLDNVDYKGELRIAQFIYKLIEATDTKGKSAFAEK